MTVVDRRTYQTRQAWEYTEHRVYGRNVRRVHIKRDAFDHQSKASVYQWSESNGWLFVIGLPITHTAAAEVSHVWEPGQIGTQFTDTAQRLFDLAEELLD